MQFFSSLLLAALAAPATAYDIGCLYPAEMPDPFAARYAIHEYSTSFFTSISIETPIAIHVSSLSSLCQANCVAYHDNDMLNAITLERPVVSTPEQYHNSWSRMLCMAQCHELLTEGAGNLGLFDPFWKKWGLYGQIEPRKDIVGFAWLTARDSGDPSSLELLLKNEDYHPFMVGQIVAVEILFHVMQDGWNALGNFTYDTETGQEVPCTANCEAYKDTHGYFPQNFPTGKPENGTAKYIVEGKDAHWQPLTDTDMNGFFSDQKHVTPHIGYKAQSRLYESVDDFPQAPDPEYDFREEALKVVERLKETSSDPMKKQKIAFFDNKLLVINLIENHLKEQFKEDYLFEEEVLYVEGIASGELEATLMAWREKVRHDIVRPTTVIQRWGSDKLMTFGGDKGHDGPVEINARDFQAFQRVMPHAEYPSGSSCICTAYSEFTDAFTKGTYNGTVTDLRWGAYGENPNPNAGFGCIPDQDPPLLIKRGCEDDFTIPDMETLLHECSQSRLWAGFHFTAAVTEGEKLCAGVGHMAWDKVQKIRNGSTFGQSMTRGGPRPQCLSGDVSVGRTGDDEEAALQSSGATSIAMAATSVVSLLVAALAV